MDVGKLTYYYHHQLIGRQHDSRKCGNSGGNSFANFVQYIASIRHATFLHCFPPRYAHKTIADHGPPPRNVLNFRSDRT